jgi:hypothetical protein
MRTYEDVEEVPQSKVGSSLESPGHFALRKNKRFQPDDADPRGISNDMNEYHRDKQSGKPTGKTATPISTGASDLDGFRNCFMYVMPDCAGSAATTQSEHAKSTRLRVRLFPPDRRILQSNTSASRLSRGAWHLSRIFAYCS